MNITIIGAGNGGQAMAGHFALLGHKITLYNRDLSKIVSILDNKGINLEGEIEGFGEIDVVTNDLELAIKDAELIMITTIANAHKELAIKMGHILKPDQLVVLNPGRTLGAFEFYTTIFEKYNKKIFVAEAQSLIYACRAQGDGRVTIIGVKDRVLFSAYPTINTEKLCSKLNLVYSCFIPVQSIFQTSLENIGAMLHPAVIMFNAATIERGQSFYFYNDITPKIASKLKSLSEWISYAYSKSEGDSLCEQIKNNKAYFRIKSPNQLESRLLLEDIPTGILPMIEIAKIIGVKTPLMESVCTISSQLLKIDFNIDGRTLNNLGLANYSKEEFINLLNN
jgi:opine dehydrogenase